MTLRIGALFGAAAICAACLSGTVAAQDIKPGELVTQGKLTYGVTPAFQPFEFLNGDTIVGFDVEMAALLAAKLGLEAEPLSMAFDGLLPALQGNRIDIINSGMYINEKRLEQADLIPYLRVGQEIVVRAGNPKGIQSRDDVCGTRIGVSTGTIQELNAKADVARCAEAGREAVEVLTFPPGGSVVALRQGRIDVYYIATPTAVVLVAEHPEAFEIAGETFEANTLLGIGVDKSKAELKTAVETALAEIREDGSLMEVAKKYGIPASSLSGF
ncbi:ABC transporter substrate-binding protein [Acuticoccus kandeliae]|uniref:ABC transporter substrate-binding protein n=1 Tax=Acuticoccus kandeliae TaxID=2073160 RepID=UPI001300AE6D|nr:ABC transporter substrate-binding protein [Acuticoccus kandeliae]